MFGGKASARLKNGGWSQLPSLGYQPPLLTHPACGPLARPVLNTFTAVLHIRAKQELGTGESPGLMMGQER